MSSRHPNSSAAGAPFTGGAAVVPSDTVDLPQVALLYVGTEGDMSIVTHDNSTLVLKNHPAGYMPGFVRRVNATGTTASNIVALW